jgi:parvulin-like peptidyl-prolyl isomerase
MEVRFATLFMVMLSGALLTLLGAAGALWLTHGEPPWSTQREQPSAQAPAPTTTDGVRTDTRIERADIEKLLLAVDLDRQAQVLTSAETFKQFVEQEALNQSMVRAAVANQAESNPQIKELMERAGQSVLAQAYMNQVIKANLDPAFPSDEQVKKYFDENGARFTTPDRVHISQIFLAAEPDATAAEVAAVEQRANDIALGLKQGKSDFAEEAARSSGHIQSRLNDGYMGLLRVEDLLPEIRSEVENLAENAVSKPIKTKDGFHIIKRGAIVKGQPLRLDEVEQQIRALMRREAEAQVRQAAADKIRQTYPTEIATSDLEVWRKQLLTPELEARGQQPGKQEEPEG